MGKQEKKHNKLMGHEDCREEKRGKRKGKIECLVEKDQRRWSANIIRITNDGVIGEEIIENQNKTKNRRESKRKNIIHKGRNQRNIRGACRAGTYLSLLGTRIRNNLRN